ncbi:hypothetical protein MSG28_012581 [Choristoneura fumiferana]|uniref:Uncharacterized protein n=1 Tax=Choristoneura fumiferana TaxID=7141 RepID=A0ACC0JH75_CHOFU|nr:hypothetical protein MSG28_012581 [Choristoneura fumiferana]
MADEDFEIEYLDEDEDVVQQCVQTVDAAASAAVALPNFPVAPKLEDNLTAPEIDTSSLLVERTPVGRPPNKRKKKREEEDSDYNPNQSDEDYEPGPRRPYKKKQTMTPRPAPTPEIKKYKPTNMSKKEEIKFRRDMGVKIPNFEDPLCLPVKAIINDENDLKKVKNWNNICLNSFKNHDTVLKPDVGVTVRSHRDVVLRNVKNKLTGKSEVTVWSKLSVHSTTDKKAEVFQSVLPKFREAKLLDYPLALPKKMKPSRTVSTVVISKEEDKAELMVVYKPQQAVSAVYRLVDDQSAEAGGPGKKEEDKKQHLQELTVCRVCAPCYQGSWRGFKKTTKKKSVVCPICVRTFVSVYNLLAHVKTHSADEVHRNKKVLGKALATVVDYHYRCRMCQEKCVSIKELRKHVLTHQSSEQFQCEVCNRVIKNASSI